jgi:DNA-binding SARP family transcriptional activator
MIQMASRVAESPGVTKEIQLLGGFSVRHCGRRMPLPATSSRLVALLALHDRALRRSFVAGILCPDATEAAAKGRLRTTVWRLASCAPELITATTSDIALAADVTADIRDIRALLIPLLYGEGPSDDAISSTVTRALTLSRVLSLELLPDWDDPWVIAERRRLRQLSLHALERLAAFSLNVGATERALVFARAATDLDPVRESAQCMLMRALLARGDRLGAVAAYGRFCDVLAREWALDPSPRLSSLALGIVRAESLVHVMQPGGIR